MKIDSILTLLRRSLTRSLALVPQGTFAGQSRKLNIVTLMTMDRMMQRSSRIRRIERNEAEIELLEEIPITLERVIGNGRFTQKGEKPRQLRALDGPPDRPMMDHWYVPCGLLIMTNTPRWRRLLLEEGRFTPMGFWLRDDETIASTIRGRRGHENESPSRETRLDYLSRWDLKALTQGLREL